MLRWAQKMKSVFNDPLTAEALADSAEMVFIPKPPTPEDRVIADVFHKRVVRSPKFARTLRSRSTARTISGILALLSFAALGTLLAISMLRYPARDFTPTEVTLLGTMLVLWGASLIASEFER